MGESHISFLNITEHVKDVQVHPKRYGKKTLTPSQSYSNIHLYETFSPKQTLACSTFGPRTGSKAT